MCVYGNCCFTERPAVQIAANKWRLTTTIGYVLFLFYLLFVIQALLRNYNVF